MIITIVDYPTRNHQRTINLLKENGVTVLNGTITELLEQTAKLKKQNDSMLIVWDYPTIIEDGYASYSDVFLVISYFYKVVTSDEKNIKKMRNFEGLCTYDIYEPCPIRDSSPSKWENQEEKVKNTIPLFVEDWTSQVERQAMTDLQMKTIARELIEKSGRTDLDLYVGSQAFDYSLAWYLQSYNRIVLNPITIRQLGYGSENAFKVIMAHELGHAVDSDLPKINVKVDDIKKQLKTASTVEEVENLMQELENLTLQKENTAFDLSYQFLDVSLHEKIEEGRKEVVLGYKNLLRDQKIRYLEELTTTQV